MVVYVRMSVIELDKPHAINIRTRQLESPQLILQSGSEKAMLTVRNLQ